MVAAIRFWEPLVWHRCELRGGAGKNRSDLACPLRHLTAPLPKPASGQLSFSGRLLGGRPWVWHPGKGPNNALLPRGADWCHTTIVADLKLTRAERRLDELLRLVDVPVDGMSGPEMVPVGLAMRSQDLYRGFKHSLSGAPLVTAAAILRSIVDLAILAAWLEQDPEGRIECWFAEDDRMSMIAVDAVVELSERRGRKRPNSYTDEERAELLAGFEEIRPIARAAGIPLRKPSLMPTTYEMAAAIPTAWELYLAFRVFSPWVHASGRSFASDELEQRKDGTHLKRGFPFPKEALRGMAATSMLYLMACTSRQIGLGWEAECDALRADLAVWTPETKKVQFSV
jgi:hypothetical protein